VFIEKRQNPVSDKNAEELDGLLKEVVGNFGEDWLTNEKEHPLGQLWSRPDPLATIELLVFGRALRRLAAFPTWLRTQVDKIKGKDANNRRGALFEILATGQLEGDNFTVEPAPANQPGYDAYVEFNCRAEMGLSLKSYDVSVHQRTFESEANQAWERLKQHLKASSQRAVELDIILEARYPTPGDWKRLRSGIARGCAALPSDASVSACAKWAEDYLADNPESPISLVFLYQIEVVKAEGQDSNFVCHHFAQAVGKRYAAWRAQWSDADLSLRIATEVGRVSTEAPQHQLTLPDEGKILLDDYYTFQKGVLYTEATINQEGRQSGEAREFAEGIAICSVLQVPGGAVVVAPRLPDSHRLLVI
jgi:hypothetical protein